MVFVLKVNLCGTKVQRVTGVRIEGLMGEPSDLDISIKVGGIISTSNRHSGSRSVVLPYRFSEDPSSM